MADLKALPSRRKCSRSRLDPTCLLCAEAVPLPMSTGQFAAHVAENLSKEPETGLVPGPGLPQEPQPSQTDFREGMLPGPTRPSASSLERKADELVETPPGQSNLHHVEEGAATACPSATSSATAPQQDGGSASRGPSLSFHGAVSYESNETCQIDSPGGLDGQQRSNGCGIPGAGTGAGHPVGGADPGTAGNRGTAAPESSRDIHLDKPSSGKTSQI